MNAIQSGLELRTLEIRTHSKSEPFFVLFLMHGLTPPRPVGRRATRYCCYVKYFFWVFYLVSDFLKKFWVLILIWRFQIKFCLWLKTLTNLDYLKTCKPDKKVLDKSFYNFRGLLFRWFLYKFFIPLLWAHSDSWHHLRRHVKWTSMSSWVHICAM